MAVVATDDLSGGFLENVPKESTWVQGDLRNRSFVRSLWVQHGPFDFVYHLAAYAAEGLSHFIRAYNYTTNLVASMHLINEAITGKAECFVFASSIAVYGRGQLPMTEDMTPLPEDPYGISKYAVELDLKAAHEMFGLNYIVFRPHNVYGERQNVADKYRNVIGIFMNQALQGQPMTVFGDGLQSRAFSHIDDVAPIIARSPLAPPAVNQIFNIGADTPYSILDLAREIAGAFAKPLQVLHLPARKEVVHAFSDHSKVRAVFAPPPSITLSSGVRRMADWVITRGPTSPVQFSDIEVREGLPGSWR
jgi:UDP-glucose 4-epimerase